MKNIVIALIVALAAAGGAAYFIMKKPAETPVAEAPAAEQVAEQTAPAATDTPAPADAVQTVPTPQGSIDGVPVKPGNPVVAKVGGKDVTRLDVFEFIQQLPANVQQLPPAQVYPLALEQVVNTEVVQAKAEQAGLESDPAVTQAVERAKEQAIRAVYLQRTLDGRITPDMIKGAYDDFIAKAPTVEERKARHILVATEDEAKAIVEELKGGADFVALASTKSQDKAAAAQGGDLGWFSKDQMVPEFSAAAFAGEKGAFTASPVKTQFGWHVIKVEDTRERPKPTMEELTPAIMAELRRVELDKLVKEWRDGTEIVKFDVNGDPVGTPPSPAAGAQAQPTPAPEAPAVEPAPAQ